MLPDENHEEIIESIQGTDVYAQCPRVPMHPNQLDGLGCGNPEDALLDLIDLKNGRLHVD